MKRKTLGAFLLTIAVSCLAGAFVSCGETSEKPPVASELNGFEVKAEITVASGAIVRPENIFVTNEIGDVVDVWVEVTDSKGNLVGLNANTFNAYDLGGYTITYVVRDTSNETYRKTTKVNVVGASKDVELTAEYETTITVGEETTITPVCNAENATFTYEVTFNGEAVETENGVFTPETYGEYKVKIVATSGDKKGEYSYSTFARTPSAVGEIESFDAEWVAYAEYSGDSRLNNWRVTDSKTEGIKDRNGNDANFLEYETSDEYIRFFISPRNEKSYYEKLAAEGYTYISTWIYVKGTIGHITQMSLDGTNHSFYTYAGPNIPANTWTQVTYTLVDGTEDWKRSFVTAYDYYADKSAYFILIDNSDAWNTQGGHEDNISIYFSDFYAIKDVTLTAKETPKTAYTIGESFAPTDLFDQATIDEYKLRFKITQSDVTTTFTDEYVFDKNSQYTIDVYSDRGDLNFLSGTSYTVSATYDVKTATTSVEKTVNQAFDLMEEFGVSVSNETLESAVFTCADAGATIDGTQFKAAFTGEYEVLITAIVLNGETIELSAPIALTVTATGEEYSWTAEQLEGSYDKRVTQTLDIVSLNTDVVPTDLPDGYTISYKLFAVSGAEEKEIAGEWTDSTLDLTDLNGKYVAKGVVLCGEAYQAFLEVAMDVYGDDTSFVSDHAPILGAPVVTRDGYDTIENEYLGDYDSKTNVTKIHASGMESLGVAFDHAYSYDTLNSLYASGLGYYVTFQVKIENLNKGKATYNGYDVGGGSISFTAGGWQTVKMNLLDAIYQGSGDNYQGRFDCAKENYLLAQAQGAVSDTRLKGYLLRLNNISNCDINVYVTQPKLLKTDTREMLVDMSVGGSTLDLATLVDVSLYDDTFTKVWTLDGNPLESSTVNTNELTDGAHTLKLVVTGTVGAYITKQPTTIYNGVINVFDSTDGLKYASVKADDVDVTVNGYYYGTKLNGKVSVVANANMTVGTGYTYVGDYYKVSYAAEEVGIWIKPEYSLDYYKFMKEKGYTGVSFDYYVPQVSTKIDMICYNGIYNNGTPVTDAWTTVTLSIDTIIENYELMQTGKYVAAENKEGYAKAHLLCIMNWGQSETLTIYVGNFRSVK